VLCPHATFQLSHTVNFTERDQQIYTQGKPRGAGRATLVLSDPTTPTAVDATNATGARLSHAVIDGGGGTSSPGPPPQEGPVPRCGPTTSDLCSGLIMFGGDAKDQTLEWVEARNTRGFTTFQCYSGVKSTVRHNLFVPNSASGDHWPYETSTQVAD